MNLANKVAIITGSSRGIGKAIAKKLAEENCKIVINCRKSIKEAKEFENSLKKFGYSCIFVQADVSKETEVRRLIETVLKKFQRIDILVNNAGIYVKSDRNRKISFKDFLEFHKTNSWGVYLCCREFGKVMDSGSVIINISSIYGIEPDENSQIASAAKAGAQSLTKSFAKFYEGRIRVNSVAPGYTDTKLVRKNIAKNELKKILQKTILKRLIKPEEVAEAILFLIKNENITGQTLVVDAGFLSET